MNVAKLSVDCGYYVRDGIGQRREFGMILALKECKMGTVPMSDRVKHGPFGIFSLGGRIA